MNLTRRFARSLAFLLPLLLFAAPPAVAKPLADKRMPDRDATAKTVRDKASAVNPDPWLYRGTDIPHDRDWIFGELPNGLRYAVRRNGVPPDQVSIRIRLDVGSLHEAENERGFAHLLEHMVFRQSKYLAEGQAIPTWQRLGAALGSDTNAETTPTQTVYKLDLPNASPASLDESFKLLSGMMIAPTLSEAGIRTEVPIVLAEMRERGGPAQRVQEQSQKTFYAGQLLAKRLPIGTEATLEGAHSGALRDFHTRWYRPENTVIIVAGDTSPEAQEDLIRKWFSDWKPAGKPTPAPSFGDPAPLMKVSAANPVDKAVVMVEPELPRMINYAYLRPWREIKDNIAYNQGLMTDALAQALINRRLEAKARAGGSYLLAQVSQSDVSRSTDGTYVSISPLGSDWQSAIRDVRAVIADALATPPTQEEIDREVAEMEISYQVPVEQQALLAGSKVADDLVSALDIRETVAAPDDVLKIFNRSKPLFKPSAVLAHTRSLFKGTVVRALLITPKAGEASEAGLKQALLAPVAPGNGVRLTAAPIRFEDLPPIGEPGTVVSQEPLGILEVEQLNFANGVKALIWPTPEEPGRMTVKVRFGGGYRAFSASDAPYIALGEMALVGSGEGKLGQEELDRITTGRKIGFKFDIDDSSFEFSGETRAADLADQLYLFAAKLAMPRWDANPVVRAKALLQSEYKAYSSSPQAVLERDLEYLQRSNDPRFRTPTPSELDRVTPEGFKQVWQRALASGPIEVQLFGDFDRKAAIAALERSFGALPARLVSAGSLAPATARFPTANAQPVTLTHRGDANQAAAIISWPTGGGMGGVVESRQLEILSQLFTNRLMDRMREKMGASYSPQVISSWPLELDSGGSLSAVAQLQPALVPAFFSAAQEIAADLISRPADADELNRVIEPLKQQITRSFTSAAYFMYQLEGATADPRRVSSLRTLMNDYTQTTPEKMQVLAKRYLGREKAWRLAVMPEAAGSVAKSTGR
jgi:zinc protease